MIESIEMRVVVISGYDRRILYLSLSIGAFIWIFMREKGIAILPFNDLQWLFRGIFECMSLLSTMF
jgi:hypothetical protein